MKQIFLILLVSISALLISAGCQEHSTNKSWVKVIIENNGEFPEFLVGRWATDAYGWEIVFERNGEISSAVISMGQVEITPGQTATFPTVGGGEAVFKPGIWTVNYDPQYRELTVEIVMDYIRFEIDQAQTLEGKATDTFIGNVSEDGKIWQADWFSIPDYIAQTPAGPKNLTVTQEESFVRTLTFRKIQE